MRVSGVHTGLVLDQVAAEQDLLGLHPGNRVAACMACARVPDIDTDATQIQADTAVSARLAVTEHQGRPGQSGHAVSTSEQTREAVHFALHVLGTAFDNQVVRALAGDDFSGTFGQISTRTQHTNRMVVGQQHVLDRLVADLTDTRNQVLRHQRRGGGVAHQYVFVADDHARIRVAFSGISPAMLAQAGETDFLIAQIALTGKGFGHGTP